MNIFHDLKERDRNPAESYQELERHSLPCKVVASKHFTAVFWLWGQHACTLVSEEGWVEFNFWLKGTFSLLIMNVLTGEQAQLDAWLLSAAHCYSSMRAFCK